MDEFKALSGQIRDFIAEKQLLGYRYNSEEDILCTFKDFVLDNNLCPIVSKETSMLWADAATSINGRNRRISIIRQFALFLNRSGITAYVIPNVYRAIEPKSFCPYIYSKDELIAMFMAADRFGQVGRHPYSSKSFPLILRQTV